MKIGLQYTRVGLSALAEFPTATADRTRSVLLFLPYYLSHWLCRKIILAKSAKVPAHLKQFQHRVVIITVNGYEAPFYRAAGEKVWTEIVFVPPEDQ